MFTRREIVKLASLPVSLTASRVLAATPPFWETKPRSQWRREEIAAILTDSPWAVGAVVRDADKARLNPTAQPWDEVPKKPKPWKVTARWESAAPIQDALAAVPNSDFENFYVINLLGDTRITGLLLQDRKLGDKLTVIRGSTTLDADDKQLWLDKLDEASHDSKRALLFYFRRRPPITEEVQHLWFATRIGAFELLAKFDAREMHYQGKLAL